MGKLDFLSWGFWDIHKKCKKSVIEWHISATRGLKHYVYSMYLLRFGSCLESHDDQYIQPSPRVTKQ